MRLGLKELDALRWLAEQADLQSLQVSTYRDQADVGWLEVLCKFPQRGTSSHLRSMKKFKVSPLGHVYDETGKVVREGPALGPDGQKRQTTRA